MGELNAKNPELAKIYFMGFADKQARVKSIEQLLANLHKQHEILSVICSEGAKFKAPPKGQDIVSFQLQSACYGRDLMQFNIEWYEKLLCKIRSNEI